MPALSADTEFWLLGVVLPPIAWLHGGGIVRTQVYYKRGSVFVFSVSESTVAGLFCSGCGLTS